MNHILRKRTVSLVLVLCLSGAMLTGCGGDKPQKPSNQPESSAPTSSAPPAESQSPSSEPELADPMDRVPDSLKGTNVQWILGYPDPNPAVTEAFVARTGIQVEVITVANTEYTTKVAGLIASGDSPDVFEQTAFPAITFDLAQPLETADIDFDDPAWDQRTFDFTSINGKPYGASIPGTVFSNVDAFYYNKALLEDNGIKTPQEYYDEGAWTWDAVRTICAEVDALGEEYLGMTDGSQAASMLSAGTDLITFDGTKFSSNLDDPRLSSFFKTQAQLKKDGLMEEWKLVDFVAGTVGLMAYTQYGLKAAGQFAPMGDDFALSPIPA